LDLSLVEWPQSPHLNHARQHSPTCDDDAASESPGAPKGTPDLEEEDTIEDQDKEEEEGARESPQNRDLPDYTLMDVDRMMDAITFIRMMECT
jgi:hypothetical protein